jgi:hypothetical protein
MEKNTTRSGKTDSSGIRFFSQFDSKIPLWPSVTSVAGILEKFFTAEHAAKT